MTTNTSMTLYHKGKNGYVRKNIDYVMWQGGIGASTNKGYENANDVTVRIPKDVNDLSDVVFDIGDIIVKGNLTNDITKKSDLLNVPNMYSITSVVDNDYGSESMRHIHITGK